MSLDADADVVVIGAGVVGLACAAALAKQGRSVLILEQHDGIARETTSRNSEVIHAGIYYPAGSLKAELCREGRRALYRRCEERGIPFRRTGKLIVATSEDEVATLERIRATAGANGVPLELIDGAEVSRREPDVRAVAALFSAETGIVDSHAYSLSFQAEAESHGAMLVLKTRVLSLEPGAHGWRVTAASGGSTPAEQARPSGEGALQTLTCGAVVNAAGLESDSVAELAGLDVDAMGYRLHLCKGDYFSLAPSAPISLSTLVYPVPVEAGLGIHATIDVGGRVRFGPDTEYIDTARYDVDPGKRAIFAEAASRYLPQVTEAWLEPDYAGVRPKLAGPGEPFADFVVAEESDAGAPGLVSCIGIESPGLTAATAIASRVVELLA